MSALNRIFRPPRRRRPPQPPPPAPPVDVPPPAEPPPSGGAVPPAGPGSYGRARFQVTTAADGEFINRMYSYWSNAWIDDSVGKAYVFVGHRSGRARFFEVDLTTGTVVPLGALLDYIGEAEGWTWDLRGKLLIPEGPRLHRVNPFNPAEDQVIFDISSRFPGCRLWQVHSSDGGGEHSATVEEITQEGPYIRRGTVVCKDGGILFYSPTKGALDESQISRDGRWVLIKEGDDNRIVDLATGNEQEIANAAGALGHSDNGPDYAVGEDDVAGACVYMPFVDPFVGRRVMFKTWNMGHVSVRAGKCLVSDGTSLTLIRFFAEGGGTVEHLIEHGMVGSDYDHQVFANLDPTGRVACYISNHGTDRFDAVLLLL